MPMRTSTYLCFQPWNQLLCKKHTSLCHPKLHKVSNTYPISPIPKLGRCRGQMVRVDRLDPSKWLVMISSLRYLSIFLTVLRSRYPIFFKVSPVTDLWCIYERAIIPAPDMTTSDDSRNPHRKKLYNFPLILQITAILCANTSMA